MLPTKKPQREGSYSQRKVFVLLLLPRQALSTTWLYLQGVAGDSPLCNDILLVKEGELSLSTITSFQSNPSVRKILVSSRLTLLQNKIHNVFITKPRLNDDQQQTNRATHSITSVFRLENVQEPNSKLIVIISGERGE